MVVRVKIRLNHYNLYNSYNLYNFPQPNQPLTNHLNAPIPFCNLTETALHAF
jgi:hypothetical protein